MQTIAFEDLHLHPVDVWLNQWFVLTSGTMEKFNMMTIAWGSLGGMWHKPFIQVVVRPQRYTYEFMENHDSFTVSAFSAEHKKELTILGTKSGRDIDKISETGFTPVLSEQIDSPSFKEAELVFECKKNYFQDIDPAHFIDPSIEKNYLENDYHRIYFGEIMLIKGNKKYITKPDE